MYQQSKEQTVMRKQMTFAIVSAFMLAASMAGAARAVDPSDSVDVSLTVTAGTQFSVEILNSNNFPDEVFTLDGPANFTDSAFYELEVVDLRGTGAGWNVVASASPFTPAIPGAGLATTNNGQWAGLPLCSSPAAGFCAGPGSISNGVSVVAGSPNIMSAASSIFTSAAGQTAAPSPFGTGTFQTEEAVYYTGLPDALSVGTYTTTVLLTLQGTAP
jgi:hypothetical protein